VSGRRNTLLDLNAYDAELPVDLPLEVRVKEGMRLLDERGPERWWERIDLDTLDVASSCNCVLGQTYGGYGDGVDALDLTTAETVAHAFYPAAGVWSVYRSACHTLTAAWREAIGARRLAEANR
jgi:hypothetical protein